MTLNKAVINDLPRFSYHLLYLYYNMGMDRDPSVHEIGPKNQKLQTSILSGKY